MTVSVRGVQLARLLGRWHALPARRRSPDYAALASSVRGLLADGRLALGVRLPAERELADALEISRTTVSAAYRELRDSGHLTSRRGAGSWTTLPSGHRVASSGLWMADDELDLIDLSCAALPAPEPLMAAAREAVEELPHYLGGVGYHPSGITELREAVADQYTERGLPTSPEQIMITNGVLHALDLILRLQVPVGASVLVESPTYPNALAAFAARRARISTHGLDEGGWDAELLLGALRQTRPSLAYLIPEFHNPTGHVMPAGLREQLVATAQRTGTDLVIDESFVDLPLDGQPMPPAVASFDRHGRVLTIGGMSKPFWGGLRVGWIRASAPIVQRLAAVRVGVDTAGPVLDQLVAVRLLSRAAEVIPQRRALLAAQRDALVAAVHEHLPSWRVTVPSGGVTLWAELDGPVSSALARAVEPLGVRLAPGPRFGVDGTLERFIRLPFTQPVPELVDGVRRIAAARYDLDRTGRPQWSEPALIA
ncbi:GntR family transcriptional regulator [Catellatospora methionotrophica]|uniref:GntR family transcriptional regulator n=1 Tax=Catellatospora methionotrophica TaxID=121620 RepID=A0A8J3L1Z4_9ACTN|nr:PLP-dependent aminotransferase family protein [Catellatospora methionotrophica]GIG12908.1 GntR family transcriptional regulator [Catellatospora methionotrophica]